MPFLTPPFTLCILTTKPWLPHINFHLVANVNLRARTVLVYSVDIYTSAYPNSPIVTGAAS